MTLDKTFFAFLLTAVLPAGVVYWAAKRLLLAPLQKNIEELERELAKERVKIETLVQNINDGLVLTNLRGEVLFINTEAMEILGAKPEEVTAANKGLYELVNKDQFRMKIQRILKSHTHSEVTELQVLSDNNRQTCYFKTTVKMFSTPIDGDFGVALLLRDVTAEKKLDSLKEEFFQAVAHDLRAPLFAVQGYLRLLEKSAPPTKQQKGYFEAISQACEKLTLFIQDTLDSARMETGTLTLSLTRVNPKTLLQRVIKLFAPLASEKKIHLKLDLPNNDKAVLEADERLMERVFYNLLSNAIKFTPAGGEITIEMSQAGPEQIEFSVADTGPGIPADKRTVIFDKYRQLNTGAMKTGFGLGLNICQKIVALHKGTIWVDSEVGIGSQFILRLPAKQSASLKTE